MPNAAAEQIIGPPLSRATAGAIEVLDVEARRVRLSFASTNPVLRANYWDEPWLEVLSHDADGPDFSGVDNGSVPVMRDHRMYELNEQIGTVERAWVEGDKSYADIRLSKRDDVSPLWGDIIDGICRNVSVTYNAEVRVLSRAEANGPSEYIVTRWRPLEISFVPVPADNTVGVGRSSTGGNARYSVRNFNGVEPMPNPSENAPATPAVNTPAADPVASRAPEQPAAPTVNAADIMKRAAEVGELCATHSMPADFTRDVLSRGLSVAETGLEILKRSKTTTPGGTAPAALPNGGAGVGTEGTTQTEIDSSWSRSISKVAGKTASR